MTKPKKVIPPKKLFRSLGVKDYEQGEKVFAGTVGFFIYLPVGHKIETSTATFEKISDDLIHVSSNINAGDLTNFMHSIGTVKFPF